MRLLPLLVFCLASLLSGSTILRAQSFHLTPRSAAVEVDGHQLRYPFAGGLNKPQASAVDFDQDGRQDLFLFDREGDTPMAFRRTENGNWQWMPELLQNFPPLTDWVLLRDYDGDGIMDLFAYSDVIGTPGVMVYRGFYQDGLIAFERVQFPAHPNDLIYVPQNVGDPYILYITYVDYPAIDDIDCDGDLDIVTFNPFGGYVEFYRNYSVEEGHGLDSLHFRYEDGCWCGIYESGITASLDLAAGPGECAQPFVDPGEGVAFRHAGSTLLTLDEDGDGDKDLILGDLSFPNLVMARNGGDCDQCWSDAEDTEYPSYDTPAYLPLFPAAFHLDVDADGRRDLLVSTNDANYAADYESFWWYRNEGTDQAPDFRLQTRSFLLEDMIDMGTAARPAALDYNADGLIDLVVGNFSYYQELNAKDTRLHLYENVGTPASPAFRLVDDDFLDLNQYSTATFNLAPTFGDLDGDGDVDALVGEQNGRLFFVENLAGANNPVQFAPAQYNYMDIDVGAASVPQIVDLNRDGLADIVLGQNSGFINYFPNQGNQDAPFFDPDEDAAPNDKRLGNVNANVPGFSGGYSSPWFVDLNGTYYLFLGTRFGEIEVYDQIDGNLDGDFQPIAPNLVDLSIGSYLQPLFVDWDDDDFFDLMVGNYRGGLNFFRTNLMIDGTVDTDERPATAALRVFPNPGRGRLTIDGGDFHLGTITVFTARGQQWRQFTAGQSPTYQFSTDDWPAGVYWLQVQGDGGPQVVKVVVL